MNPIPILFCLICLLAPEAGAVNAALAGNPVTVEISTSKAGISIGDSLTLLCTVMLPEEVQAAAPVLKEKNPFIDVDAQWSGEGKTSTGIVRRYGFLAYVSAVDSARVGPFAVRYVTAEGDSGEALSNVLDLKVAGVLKSPDDPPRPNRGPFEINARGVPFWVFPLILALAAALAVWLLLKRRKGFVPAPASERPLDEIGEFEYIRALQLREKGQVKELYAMVSSAMRGFIHRNMGFDALYSTTDEIRRMLESGWKDRETAVSIRKIFEESDMVKFAKYVPSEELSSTVIDRAIIPVKTVLGQIAAERERERLAEEERKRTSGHIPGNDPVEGERERK